MEVRGERWQRPGKNGGTGDEDVRSSVERVSIGVVGHRNTEHCADVKI